MKVTLNQEEIFTAIENYILETVRVGDNIRLDMDLAATRGAEGYTAMVTFVDITDESANPKDDVVPTEEAKGLSIVDKINEARKAPRRSPSKLPGFRQGSTAGQPIKATTVNTEAKSEPVDEQSSDLATEATENSDDVVVKHAPPKQVEAPAEVDTAEQVTAESEDHEVAENPAPDYQPEPATEAEAEAEQNDEAPAEESAQEPQEEEKPVQATSTQPRKRSLFSDPEPAPQDEAGLAAEAAATEPQEEDVDYTPTPETKGLETEDAGDPVETEKPKTRSLFGNLTKPNNG